MQEARAPEMTAEAAQNLPSPRDTAAVAASPPSTPQGAAHLQPRHLGIALQPLGMPFWESRGSLLPCLVSVLITQVQHAASVKTAQALA